MSAVTTEKTTNSTDEAALKAEIEKIKATQPQYNSEAEYKAMLIARFESGQYMTKADKKEARRLIKERDAK